VSFKTRLLSPKTLLDSTSVETHPDLLRFIDFKRERYPYLLSSSATRQNNTQHDILLACPQDVLTLNADKSLQLNSTNSHSKIDESLTTELLNESKFFDALEKLYQKDKQINSTVSSDLPFTGGWFVYLSYEMAEEVEPCLTLPSLPSGHPLAVAVRCPAAIIHNKQNNQYIAVAEKNFEYLLDNLEQDYLALLKQQAANQTDNNINIRLQSLEEDEVEPYLQQVDKIKHYIVEGDIFQANLSRRWKAHLQSEVNDLDLFRKLARHNPSSFAAIACLENITIISSSPERLVSLKDGIVETRPIAGTRPRDSNQQSDDALAKELLAHPKEQAEHIMLIDLERNDLGRVCRPGTIEVNELMALESWEHVHHIVSNVRGELENDKSPIDVLRAVFPGGTITGCPKVRCMEILAELEQEPRGAYTGSLGYINTDGSMDFNILIRTMVRETKNNADEITFRAGGGIVSDSIAEDELEETRAKAKGLLKVFQ